MYFYQNCPNLNCMKKFILLIVTSLFLYSCSNGDIPFSGKDQLPPETQNGANTVGCLVNGKVFIPHQEGLNAALSCDYFSDEDGYRYFNLVFKDSRGTGVKTVSVRTGQIDFEENSVYVLNVANTMFPYLGGGGVFSINASNYYFTNTIKTGELKITHLDPQKSIISGTFWFDAVNEAGEQVEIRQGRFDMKY